METISSPLRRERQQSLDKEGEYKLDQEEAIGDLLRKNGLADVSPMRAPIGDERYEVEAGDAEFLESSSARAGPTTRPGIAFAAHKATRQTHASRLLDWILAKRIARYRKRTAAMIILMASALDSGAQPQLEEFGDADFSADKVDRKLVTGGVVHGSQLERAQTGQRAAVHNKRLSSSPRDRSHKQGSVSLSTINAEFVTAIEVAREMLGLRKMLRGVGIEPALLESSSLKAKHVDVRHKFLCDFSRREIIGASFVRSEEMLADLMTKALDATKARRHAQPLVRQLKAFKGP
ncbi:unnamed protein product [Peronospora effusa]|nr:unnamed protein product [Peronospora effusa]